MKEIKNILLTDQLFKVFSEASSMCKLNAKDKFSQIIYNYTTGYHFDMWSRSVTTNSNKPLEF